MKKSNAAFFITALILSSTTWQGVFAQSPAGAKATIKGQRFTFQARASELDPLAAAHPEIDFVFEKGGKPQDVQNAMVDTRVPSRGKLVIWLMGHNKELFERVTGYGLHAIQPHYANKWFSIVCQEKPVGEMCRGNVRLEAATGEDFSDQVDIPKHDGLKFRSTMFVKWLATQNPEGRWEQFLSDDGNDLQWEKVILTGISHGSTTAARFAKHQRVDRVVMFSGPRDQFQQWQSLPSATPENRYFGFTHILDTGWVDSHYCRSWEMLRLHNFGAIVDVDKFPPPYDNTRRLITNFDVNRDAGRAHSGVVPGKAAGKDKDGNYLHEAVWRYLFTHPVDQTGQPVPMDDNCVKNIPQ
jgi:hypothetical protein